MKQSLDRLKCFFGGSFILGLIWHNYWIYCCITWKKIPLVLNPLSNHFCVFPYFVIWKIRNTDFLFIFSKPPLVLWTSVSPWAVLSFSGCTVLVSLVFVCLMSFVTPNITLTFLMPLHILQYPLEHRQGFYLIFCPFTGWKLHPHGACCLLQVACGPCFD